MKDLKIYYVTDDGSLPIDCFAESIFELVAKFFNVKFVGSGVEIGKKIRDIHYRKKK